MKTAMAISSLKQQEEDAQQADSPLPQFHAIRSPRAFEEIVEQIRAELAQGRLKVGNRLPAERLLAMQFGVSRNTLREALRSLEHAGLIRLQKGASGGAFICEGSGDVIANGLLDLYHVGSITPTQLTEARVWLESVIVREACRRASQEDIEMLEQNIAAAVEASKEDDFPRRARIHFEFHRMLARMTGNPIMVVMMDGLLAVLSRYVTSLGDRDNSFVIPSRKRFIKHLREGDAEAAVAEMESSLKRLQRSYLSQMKEELTGSAGEGRGAATHSTRA
jgi:DNA-binding FadR family transcriptional regulator